MTALIVVSMIWAFSFGLIKGQLTTLDPAFVATTRLLLAWLVFLPFTRLNHCRARTALLLTAIGAVQYGIMYVAYTAAFGYLHGYQVALFTIFTPLYITIIDDLFCRKFQRRFFIVAVLTVLGSGVMLFRDFHHDEFRSGFLLIQLANLCFAFGQVAYKKVMRHSPATDLQVFSWLYFGAVLCTLPMVLLHSGLAWPALDRLQLLALLYLGVLASGVCFFLWNYGARQVNTGTLALCNNLKVPLAIACSALFFHEAINGGQLLAGSAILGLALLVNRQR